MKWSSAYCLALAALPWCLVSVNAHELAPVEVVGRRDNVLGTSDAASQGVIDAQALRDRHMSRPAEVLEDIPGMVVSQHSGDGKANQYFVRGINLDHGTDFATTLNGVPLNLPSHAHGQGYTDLNLLMPELVSRIDYRKGPYFASEGDFSSAGSSQVMYKTSLEHPIAHMSLGSGGYARAMVAGSREVSDGVTLLTALERLNNNGPWATPQGYRKLNSQFILSGGSPRQGWTTSVSAYEAHWTATDQVPQRLIDAGAYQGQPFDRWSTLDPTDGGATRRASLSGTWHQASDHEQTQASWYAIQYDFQLFSNFTYSLERASDQFAQADRRTAMGGKVSRSWLVDVGATSLINTLGLQVRHDRARVDLYDSAARQLQVLVRDDLVQQTALGVYGDSEMEWTSWLRSVLGVRVDQLDAQVHSAKQYNSGAAHAALVSPKLSLILGPWHQTEWFINAGHGFHSNDARGATVRVDPRTAAAVDTVPLLVRTRGQELGVKTQWLPGLQMALSVWRLDTDSELIYLGDVGTTVAGRPARRDGVEWSHHWVPGSRVGVDASLAWTHPRYTDASALGPYIPNAVQKVARATLTLKNLGSWSGSMSLRYIGAAPLSEDNSVRSASQLSANLRITRQLSREVEASLDILNVADRKNYDMSYFYASRLAGEAGAVKDVHVHPAELRSIRFSTRVTF